VRALPPDRGGLVPAAAITSFARTEDRQRAFEAGYDEYIVKPVEPAQFVQTVAKLARGRAHDVRVDIPRGLASELERARERSALPDARVNEA
jgi:DNA-binding response OmpR family regulator